MNDFRTLVLHWFDKHGRKTLPWQKNPTPYRVLVSEVMLQQTQVNTVMKYYSRFIRAFPSFVSLAKAKEDKVLQLWSGLGYYARARNLHRTAQIICEKYQGKFPSNYAEVMALPGIGRSTAGAILSFSYGARYPILDGNVRRVLMRVLGLTASLKELWEHAERLTPLHHVAEYNQAMIDLGALVCTRRSPRCDECPLQQKCIAHKEGKVQDIPATQPHPPKPVKRTWFLIIVCRLKSVLLEKQKEEGVWKGLWSFPRCEEKPTPRSNASSGTRGGTQMPEFWPCFRHTFTHFHWDITPVVFHVRSHPIRSQNVLWYSLEHSKKQPSVGLPAPVQRLIREVRQCCFSGAINRIMPEK